MDQRTTRIRFHINASKEKIFGALIDGNAIQKWRIPKTMKSKVHYFEGKEGGEFRISLTYDYATEAGKTTENTDTYIGRFVKLIPFKKVVEEDEFETTNPVLQGKMNISFTLKDSGRGTDIFAVHKNLPQGISLTDNEKGWHEALANLKAMLEAKKHS